MSTTMTELQYDTEQAASPTTLSYRLQIAEGEEEAKAAAAILRKAATPLPSNLRLAVGRRLVQTTCRAIQKHLKNLTYYDEAPPPKGKGTPGKGQTWRKVRPPRWIGTRRLEALKLAPQAALEQLEKALILSEPAPVGALSYGLLQQVEKERLLTGYSSVAAVAGCMQFAAFVLETTLSHSKKKLKNAGLKVNVHGVRCAYNDLWLVRGRLEETVKEQGFTLENLHPPISREGGVSNKIIREDAERERVESQKVEKKEKKEKKDREQMLGKKEKKEKKHGGKKRKTWKPNRPSKLQMVESTDEAVDAHESK